MSKIACDLDGVVFQFTTKFIEFYNARFGLNDKPDDVTDWNWWTCPNISVTKEQFLQAMDEFTKLRVWQNIPIYDDVYANLCALSLAGHEIVYLTVRPPEARRATAKSIIKNGLPFDGLIFTEHENKIDVAKAIGCDCAIDDKLETVYSYAANKMHVYLKLLNHNRTGWQNALAASKLYRKVVSRDIDYITPVESFQEFAQYFIETV